GQRGGVMVHGLAHKDPAHMSPPFTVDGRMRVAVHIGKLMMNAVRSHPENRSAFESEGGANCEEIFYPLRRLVAAVRQQAVISHSDAQTTRHPPQEHGDEQRLPGKEKQ